MSRTHLFILIALASSSAVFAAINDPVRLDTGMISGVMGNSPGVRVYKGIPFAAPPVGDLRFRAPQPPAKWDGTRMADQFGPMCMQGGAGGGRGGAKGGKGPAPPVPTQRQKDRSQRRASNQRKILVGLECALAYPGL